MPDDPNSTGPNSDYQDPLERLRDHGLDRRGVMKLLGAGAGMAALGGTAVAANGRDARIDEVFGATFVKGETPPPGLVDHDVELRATPGVHGDFPLLADDSVDRNPSAPGVQGDPDAAPDELPQEFFFDPVGLHVEPGDVVAFPVVENHVHTVTSFAPKYEGLPPRIPGGASVFTSPPVGGGDAWLYRFDAEGVYDVACLPHFPLGMVLRVVVLDPKRRRGDLSADGYGPLPASGSPAMPFYNANLVLTSAELAPENVVAEGAIGWGDLSLP